MYDMYMQRHTCPCEYYRILPGLYICSTYVTPYPSKYILLHNPMNPPPSILTPAFGLHTVSRPSLLVSFHGSTSSSDSPLVCAISTLTSSSIASLDTSAEVFSTSFTFRCLDLGSTLLRSHSLPPLPNPAPTSSTFSNMNGKPCSLTACRLLSVWVMLGLNVTNLPNGFRALLSISRYKDGSGRSRMACARKGFSSLDARREDRKSTIPPT